MWSIVLKEYRQRARGVATLGLIMAYTIILGLVAYIVYLGAYTALANQTKSSGDVGLAMSVATFFTQLIMAVLLSLSLNASTIATEKDQETFDLLNLTLFKSSEIVIGKFLSSTGFLFLLVVTALPIYVLAWTFGGIREQSFWELAAVVVGMTLFISSIGLLLSLVSPDVRTALSRSFFVLIALTGVTLFFGLALVGSFNQQPPNIVTYWVGAFSLLVNPLFSAIDVLSDLGGATGIAWQNPPAFVPSLVNYKLLWVWSASFQTALAMAIIGITIMVYPKYRASKTGGVL